MVFCVFSVDRSSGSLLPKDLMSGSSYILEANRKVCGTEIIYSEVVNWAWISWRMEECWGKNIASFSDTLWSPIVLREDEKHDDPFIWCNTVVSCSKSIYKANLEVFCLLCWMNFFRPSIVVSLFFVFFFNKKTKDNQETNIQEYIFCPKSQDQNFKRKLEEVN